MLANFDFDVIQRSWYYLFTTGMKFTLTLTFFAMLGGILFGTLLADHDGLGTDHLELGFQGVRVPGPRHQAADPFGFKAFVGLLEGFPFPEGILGQNGEEQEQKQEIPQEEQVPESEDLIEEELPEFHRPRY